MKIWLLALLVCCPGCGTIMTRYAGPRWSPPGPSLPRVYSGALFDFRCFLRPSMYDTQGLGAYCLVDAPFSIVADTVILPLTIYEQIRFGSYASAAGRTE